SQHQPTGDSENVRGYAGQLDIGDLQQLQQAIALCGLIFHQLTESAGVYWKPVYAILEGGALEIVVANAHHVKKVPGRKTDVKDGSGSRTCSATGCCALASFPPNPSGSCAI